jgi:hypothetical protein
MSVDLFLDEKMFISVKRASQETGYSQDYIGQLSRKGKIPAKLVGRSWFVNIDSLRSHKKSVEVKTLKRDEVSLNSVDNKTDLGMTRVLVDRNNDITRDFDIPKLVKKGKSVNFFNLGTKRFLVGSAALVAVFVLAGSSYSLISYFSPNILSEMDSKVASYYTGLTTLVSNTKNSLTNFDLAQVSGSTSDEPSEDSGIVVLPSSEDKQEKIDLVKKNFSDDVEVYFDTDDQSGVIKPVFRSNQIGEDYVFVMVPIKERK